MQTGLVVETGEARESAPLLRAGGVWRGSDQPLSRVRDIGKPCGPNATLDLAPEKVQQNYIKGVGKGIRKVMSKMGISTYQSYCGAQIFDAVGLSSAFVEQFFTGTATTIEGIGLAEVAEEALRRHGQAYGDNPIYDGMLDVGGIYQYRLRGEQHAWTPQNVAQLQHAVRGNDPKNYAEFAASINEQSERLLTIRGLLEFRKAKKPIPLEEVEPASENRQAVLDRGDEPRLDQPRSPFDHGDCDEPHRRALEHRRRRGGAVPLHSDG